jgi:hypothetical protein
MKQNYSLLYYLNEYNCEKYNLQIYFPLKNNALCFAKTNWTIKRQTYIMQNVSNEHVPPIVHIIKHFKGILWGNWGTLLEMMIIWLPLTFIFFQISWIHLWNNLYFQITSDDK